jgi:hypothetical protein
VVVLHVCQAWVRLKVRVAVCAQEQQGSEHYAQERSALSLVDAQLASQLQHMCAGGALYTAPIATDACAA